ncbi:hypothetical protein [Paenimyroides baculatum]|uniref:Uncharacterized protein n=1 Tax=Paenimyroides baculatum TaxID=2608000 RepID=A0A5M6CMW1_9FLAO|nr:hypothetical protein [Paenimyroides baculatum]KAA5535322.1 hypothetical protein F0460_08380 [Paenimyroides baculatum]
MSIKASYIFIITAIVYFLISVIFKSEYYSSFDINSGDSFIITANLNLTLIASIFIFCQGILYLIIEKMKLKLYSLLIKLHFLFVVIFLSILIFLLNFESNYDNLKWFNIGIFIAFLGCILIPTINLIFSVLNRKI